MRTKSVPAVGVDAGSDRTRVVVLLLEDQRVRFLGCGETPSQGWQKSRIADAQAVADSIAAAIHQAEQAAQLPIESAVLGAGGSTVGCGVSRGGYENAYQREINGHDVNRVVERASHVRFEPDRMLLHLCLHNFSLDGHGGVRDPRGRAATHLEAYVRLITFSTQEHDALLAAAHRAQLVVEETVFEPMAAAYACLRAEHRRNGVVLLDIGAESTDVIVYQADAVALAASLPLGGAYFTRDVVHGLGIAWEDAEAVKIQYGCALRRLSAEGSLVEIPPAPGRPAREMPRAELSFILEARAFQLFRLVRRELLRARLTEAPSAVVLCGGMAHLNGMCDVAEQVLGCPARWGLPSGIRDWPADRLDPAWTTAAGLAMYSARLKQRELQRPRRGLLERVFG